MSSVNNVVDEYFNQFEDVLLPGRLPSMTRDWKPIVPVHKDRYLTPEKLKKLVADSARINKVLDEMSENDKNKKKVLALKVKEMLDEIGFDRNVTVLRWLGMLIETTMRRICTSVYVNKTNLENLKKTIGNQQVIYLPSHRSYADFTLMSYLCFCHDLEIPAIAAGMDFHGMVGMGSLLRKTGAFFMRRKFVTDKLYWYVFKEYMHLLMTSYHTGVEFFIEGTRSRSYKALSPKIGLLSMALEPLFMGELNDVTIVPITISYERPLEEQLFVFELLGVPKPKESTFGLVKSLFTIDKCSGSVFFDFGKPMSVKEYFGDKLNRYQHATEPAHIQNLTKNDLNLITDLAHEVVFRQQQTMIINSFNLIALYFSYRMYSNKTTSYLELCEGVLLLYKLLKRKKALIFIDPSMIEQCVTESLKLHSNVLQISSNNEKIELLKPIISLKNANQLKFKAHSLSEATMKNSVPIFTLQLYINPLMHWMALPAFMIICCQKLTNNGIESSTLEALRTETNELRTIFCNEFVLYPGRENEEFFENIEYLKNYNIILQQVTPDNHAQFQYNPTKLNNIFLCAIAPFLCCYYQTTQTILYQFSSREFTDKDLLMKVQEHIEISLLRHDDFIHPYCLSLDSISIALNSFCQMNCISKSKRDSTTLYSVNLELTLKMHRLLKEYCQLLPFNYLTEYTVPSKL